MTGAELPRVDQFLQGLRALVGCLNEGLGTFDAQLREGFVDLRREREHLLVLELAHGDPDRLDGGRERAKRLTGLLDEVFVEDGQACRRLFPRIQDLLKVTDGRGREQLQLLTTLDPEPRIGRRQRFGLFLRVSVAALVASAAAS